MRLNRVSIRTLLAQRDLKQKDIQERTGLAHSTVSTILCGKSCSQETAEKIAAALGVDLEQIIEKRWK